MLLLLITVSFGSVFIPGMVFYFIKRKLTIEENSKTYGTEDPIIPLGVHFLFCIFAGFLYSIPYVYFHSLDTSFIEVGLKLWSFIIGVGIFISFGIVFKPSDYD